MFIIGHVQILTRRTYENPVQILSLQNAADLPVKAHTLRQANSAATAYFNGPCNRSDGEIAFGGDPSVYQRDVWDANHNGENCEPEF